MVHSSDQTYAADLLAVKNKGYPFKRHIQANKRYYIRLAAFGLIASVLLIFLKMWSVLCVVLGMIVGSILRDFAWVKNLKKSLPFSMRVTDWNKVESIAKEGFGQ